MLDRMGKLRDFLGYWLIVIMPPHPVYSWLLRAALPFASDYAYAADVANMEPEPYWRAAALYDHVCPGGDGWARDCIARGDCGCSNKDKAK